MRYTTLAPFACQTMGMNALAPFFGANARGQSHFRGNRRIIFSNTANRVAVGCEQHAFVLKPQFEYFRIRAQTLHGRLIIVAAVPPDFHDALVARVEQFAGEWVGFNREIASDVALCVGQRGWKSKSL